MSKLTFGLFVFIFCSSYCFANLSENSRKLLENRRSQIQSWAPRCSDGTLTLHECPFGDAVEYMGMLCMSGDKEFCQYVKEAQDPTGRWWRSPGLVGDEDGFDNSGWATFSRDMARGAWAYIVTTKDKEAATKWIRYIEGNQNRLCPRSKAGPDACATRAGFWAFAGQVFDYLQIPRTKKMKKYKNVIEAVYSPLEARVQPIGYQSILTAEYILTLQYMESRGHKLQNNKTISKMAKILLKREPENALYRYLVHGSDEKVSDLLLKYCPQERPIVPEDVWGPIFTVEFGDAMHLGKNQFGGGHYCVFLINTVLKDKLR